MIINGKHITELYIQSRHEKAIHRANSIVSQQKKSDIEKFLNHTQTGLKILLKNKIDMDRIHKWLLESYEIDIPPKYIVNYVKKYKKPRVTVFL